MVHHGQGLAFGLEAGQDLIAAQIGLDDLEGDAARHRLGLLGHPDDAHAALAEFLQELVGADHHAGGFFFGMVAGGRSATTHGGRARC